MPRYKRTYGGYKKRKLNVDKKLLLSSGVLTGGTQGNVLLYTASEACVVKGLRLEGSVQTLVEQGVIPQSPSNVRWALVVIREGYTPNNINSGNSGDFYIPEQDVWAWGSGQSLIGINNDGDSTAAYNYHFDVAPKTSRKMQEGDTIYLCVLAQENGETNINTQLFVCQ